jgi:hypothetical protein
VIIHNADRDLMNVFEVKMLRRIKGSGVGVGQKAFGSKMPTGKIYLAKHGHLGTPHMDSVFTTDAIEGVDFERI